MRSGWFDCTEPSQSTALQGKQGVQGAYALVMVYGFLVFLSYEFGVVRLYRTFSIYILAGMAGWFKHIEPHRTYTNHTITEIVQELYFCHRIFQVCTL